MITSFLQKIKVNSELKRIYHQLKLISQNEFFNIIIEKNIKESLQNVLSDLDSFYEDFIGMKCIFHFPNSLLDIEILELEKNLEKISNSPDSRGFIFIVVTYSYNTSLREKIKVNSFFRIGQFYTLDYFI